MWSVTFFDVRDARQRGWSPLIVLVNGFLKINDILNYIHHFL